MAQDRSKITSRAQLVQLNSQGQQLPSSMPLPPAGHLVHGLVNTGNSCFLNSVLQALSSLDLFLPYLETLLEHSEALQVAEEEVQVAEALADTLQALQQPTSSHKAFRPRAIVDALSNFRRKATVSSRGYHGNLMNREQQDAQELFQLISSALSAEELFVQKATLSRIKSDVRRIEALNRPPAPSRQGQKLTGSVLRRRRRRHLSSHQRRFSSDSEDDSEDDSEEDSEDDSEDGSEDGSEDDSLSSLSFTEGEDEDDHFWEDDDMEESETDLTHALRQDRLWGTSSNIEQLKATLIRQQLMLERALKADIEAPLPDVKLSSTVSRHCTKQVMLAKPPPVLCLHFVRSQYSMYGTISKNGCQVRFPEYLNLSPFCTTGVLLTQPNLPMSVSTQELERLERMQTSPRQHEEPTITPTTEKTMKRRQQRQRTQKQQEGQHEELGEQSTTARESEVRYIYRLQSIVVHFGGHSYGHFIAYRRKPESLRSQAKAGPVGLGLTDATTAMADGKDWFRISDETVESVSTDQALGANPYMLLYERVILPDQEPTVQHRQAQTCKTSGASLLPSPAARSRSIVQAVGLSMRKAEVGLRSRKQAEAADTHQFDKDRLEDSRHLGSRKMEDLYHEIQYPLAQRRRQQQQSNRDGEDMSDMESLQSLDEEDGSGRRGGWRSFVSSPNSTTPPSPDTGTSTCSSPSLASPVVRHRTRLARGLQRRLSGQGEGCGGRHDGIEGTDCTDEGMEELTETDEWANDRDDHDPQQQQQQQREGHPDGAMISPEPDALSDSLLLSSTLDLPYPSPVLDSQSRLQSPSPTPSENSCCSTPTPTSMVTPSTSPPHSPASSKIRGKKRGGSKKTKK
ncbi:hypothetical protein DFQ27_004057 [Actinomortierella ambigua]|uniref:Ubiquitin carboxyl-terminal hydrolase n=1 Tax=Actinomortierella ambigua TaxID=1343610 RepID=A0A9P6Q2Y6_9FUNG|nr:hypothetical protein DFQ27_004057 [Actinomortierella ambigua]